MKCIRLALLSLAIGCTPNPGENVDSPKRKVDTVGRSYVTFEGRWRTISESGSRSIPRLNTAVGYCEKATMTCNENIAKLYSKDEWPGHPNGFLRVAGTDFKVIEWSKDRIIARYEAPVADLELRISLSDGSAERSFRETKARGSDTADPKIAGHWVLE
jgi:hypothetical protein